MPSSITPNGEQAISNGDDEMTPEQSEAQMRRALDTLSANTPAKSNSGSIQSFNRPSNQKSPSHTPGYAAAAARKHRFVQDGEVQVVHLPLQKDRPNAERPRDAAPLSGIDPRAGQNRPDRALQDAQAAIRGMQTKLAHAEIALSEAVQRANVQAEAVSAARAELQQARAETRLAEQSRLSLEQRLTTLRETLEAEISRLRDEADALRAEAEALRAAHAAAVSEPEPAAAELFFHNPQEAPPPKPERKLRAKSGPKPRKAPADMPELTLGPDSDPSEPEPVKWWLATRPKPARAKRPDKKA